MFSYPNIFAILAGICIYNFFNSVVKIMIDKVLKFSLDKKDKNS